MTLTNYPYRPQDHLALSLGPATLGAMVAVVPRETSGRVNRAFDQVTADGQLYCYSSAEPGANASWLLSLSADNRLTIARVTHSPAESPCVADPATWSLGAGAVTMVR